MRVLALGEFHGWTAADIKAHIAREYAHGRGADSGRPTEAEQRECANDLRRFSLIIAYQSPSDYEESSWFLMREKATGQLYEFSGGHCSCYGWEGQYSPEATSLEYLTSDRFHCPARGHEDAVREHLGLEFSKLKEGAKERKKQ